MHSRKPVWRGAVLHDRRAAACWRWMPTTQPHTHNLQLDNFAIQLHCPDFLQAIAARHGRSDLHAASAAQLQQSTSHPWAPRAQAGAPAKEALAPRANSRSLRQWWRCSSPCMCHPAKFKHPRTSAVGTLRKAASGTELRTAAPRSRLRSRLLGTAAAAAPNTRARLTANRSSRQDLPTPESPMSRSCSRGGGGGTGAGRSVRRDHSQSAEAFAAAAASGPAHGKRGRRGGPTLNRKSYSDWCAIVPSRPL